MNQFLNNLYVFTLLMFVDNEFVATANEELTIDDFNNSKLSKYSVDDNTSIVFRKVGNMTIYLQYYGNYCYDLQNIVGNKIIQMNNSYVIKLSEDVRV